MILRRKKHKSDVVKTSSANRNMITSKQTCKRPKRKYKPSDVEVSHVKEDSKIRRFEDSISAKLSRVDFQKPGLDLAKYLLGKLLVRVEGNTKLIGRIVETEAYLGEIDKACHAYGGKKTERTKVMYKEEGTAYVYSIYGMYFCLNISSADIGGCVLIRALEPVQGFDVMTKRRSIKRKPNSLLLKIHDLCSGPSKLCQALNITKQNLNGEDMASSDIFYVIDDGFQTESNPIVTCKRIGIDGYGVEWASKPYRFYFLGNKNVSVRDKLSEKLASDVNHTTDFAN